MKVDEEMIVNEGYRYENWKREIFTEKGQEQFLKVRDKVRALLSIAGSFKMEKLYNISGDSWLTLACVDRLLELEEIKELKRKCSTQDRVFEDDKLLQHYRSLPQ